MARIQNALTDYDRAVRAIDRSISDPEYSLDKFIYHPSDEIKERRRKLVKKILYYRKPENMELYHARYLRIQTKLEGIVNFKWKPAQRKLYNQHILPKILNNEPVRIYILKARQIGFSTQIEGLGTALCSLFSDIRSGVVAHDTETATKIHRMCKLFYKRLPNHFRPARKLSNRKELELANPRETGELGLESSFTVATARNPHLGAGTTLRYIHLSEFARYEEVNSEIEESLTALYQTIPELGGTFLFIETTAYGEGIGKRYWDDPSNGFDKVFVSWVADEDYRLSNPISERDIQYDDRSQFGDELKVRDQIIDELKFWYPNESTDNDWLNHEVLCRLAWRRQYISQKTHGKVDLFQQEYPLTPEEAFRLSGKAVFSTYHLIGMKKRAENIKYEQYTYVPEATKNRPSKLGHFEKDTFGHLKIFEFPEKDKFYYLGLDVGSGVNDGDFSVGQVFDHKYNQVAVFRDIIEPDLLAYPIVTLAKLYKDARIIPEANSMGISTISRIVRDLEYSNVYVRKKINRIDGSLSNEWGFFTSAKTRPLLVNKLRQMIYTNQLQLYDMETIEEFLAFVFIIKNNIIKMEASPGKHDDTVMSTGLAILDIEPEEEIIKKHMSEAPYGSIEWHARKMDEGSRNNLSSFGSPTGL